jgi:hypothetical protein
MFKGDIDMEKRENNSNEKCLTYSQMNLIFNARLFWRRFSLWIRIYLIDRYYGVGTAEEAFGRLYLESRDFGDMLRIIFGRRNAEAYAQLLNNYTFLIRDLVSAQLAGDTAAINQHVNELYQNVEDRAKFLASINPYFNESEWRDLLRTYLQLAIEVANTFASGDFAAGVKTYDQLTDFTSRMGDVFARGLYEYITSGGQFGGSQTQENQHCFTYEQMNNIYNIRMLWYELAYWTRAYMLSRIYGVGDPSDALARLKQVPQRYITGLLAVFGTNYIVQDVDILNRYIELIDALITAQLEGNTDEVNSVVQNLYKNSDERAAFLASINPYWTQDNWRAILNQNIRSTIDELNTFLTKDYARNLDIFDSILDQAENASDYYEQGLLNYLSRQNSSGKM